MSGRPQLLTVALAAALTFAAAGCMKVPVESKMAYLKVVAQPAATTVYVSDRFIGSARLLQKQPKALTPGVKYVTFKAPGYFPHDLRLELPKGETVVSIKLRPIPP
jgi:hypothetical protein